MNTYWGVAMIVVYVLIVVGVAWRKWK